MIYSHEPVLLSESLTNLLVDKSGSYLDCTFGLGGHSKKILENLSSDGLLYSIDKDIEVKKMQFLYSEEKDLVFMNSNTFEQINIGKNLIEEKIKWMKEGDEYEISMWEDKWVFSASDLNQRQFISFDSIAIWEI